MSRNTAAGDWITQGGPGRSTGGQPPPAGPGRNPTRLENFVGELQMVTKLLGECVGRLDDRLGQLEGPSPAPEEKGIDTNRVTSDRTLDLIGNEIAGLRILLSALDHHVARVEQL